MSCFWSVHFVGVVGVGVVVQLCVGVVTLEDRIMVGDPFQDILVHGKKDNLLIQQKRAISK